jgi:hypothetical protein
MDEFAEMDSNSPEATARNVSVRLTNAELASLAGTAREGLPGLRLKADSRAPLGTRRQAVFVAKYRLSTLRRATPLYPPFGSTPER